MRALGVMDGVRRPGQVGGPLNLQRSHSSAAVLAMPQGPQTVAVDGLRRIAQVIAAPPPQPALAVAMPLPIPNVEPRSARFTPLAMAGLAGLPMLAAGSIIGVRTFINHRHAVVTLPKVTPTAAASAAPAPAPTTPSTQEATAAAAAASEAQSLQTLLDGFNISSTYSLYVQDLNTGQLATVGPDRSFRSASLYKLFVASQIYSRIDAGSLNYNSVVPGTGNNVSGCLSLMITISDNTCGDGLGEMLGWNGLTQTLHAAGFTGTTLTQPQVTTPRDVAKLLGKLYSGTLNSSASNTQFMNLLKAQKVNNRLPQGLPAGFSIAHKTGDLYGFMHDAGIVFGPKSNYLVVMMGAPGAAPSDFAHVSSQLASFFAK